MSAQGQPVQRGGHGHEITVPASAGSPPYCSCGVIGGNGKDKPLLAHHIAEVRRDAGLPLDDRDRWLLGITEPV